MTKKAMPELPLRVLGADRSRAIVSEASALFSEQGFDASLRTLADRLKTPVSVLYRHFDGKQSLIDQVFFETFLAAWSDVPERVLADRALPLAERLVSFYRPYALRICSRPWSRLFLFSGLAYPEKTRAYLDMVRERVVLPICVEGRAAAGLCLPANSADLSETEVERSWAIFAKLIYLGVRHNVWAPTSAKLTSRVIAASVTNAVNTYLGGALSIPPKTK